MLRGPHTLLVSNSLDIPSMLPRESNASVIKMTASLVFKNVAEEDLSKLYTCRLESVTGPQSSVTITLARKGKQDGMVERRLCLCFLTVSAVYCKAQTRSADVAAVSNPHVQITRTLHGGLLLWIKLCVPYIPTAAPSSLSLALGIAAVVLVILVTIAVLVKLKMDTCTLCGTICCHHKPSGGILFAFDTHTFVYTV